MKDYKLLGHCQVCGRTQAVNGGMSKHGYTVEQGWFNGVCSGQNHLPMEQDDTLTKQVCANIADEIVELQRIIDGLKNGTITPKTAPVSIFYKAKHVSFNEAPENMQKKEVQSHIWNNESRIRQGQSHIEVLTKLSQRVKGQDLVQESKPAKASPISYGEKRMLRGRVVECKSTVGQRVNYKDERGFNSYTSPQAWRKLELVA